MASANKSVTTPEIVATVPGKGEKIALGFHAATALAFAIALIVRGASDDTEREERMPLGLYRHAYERRKIGDPNATKTTAVSNSSISVTPTLLLWCVVVFHALTAVGHGVAYHNRAATARREVNTYRWVEYSVTATLMMFIIAQTSGVMSEDSLWLILAATACTMPMGFVVEKEIAGQKRTRQTESGVTPDRSLAWVATFVGWLLTAMAWFVVIRSFIERVGEVSDAGDDALDGVPTFVYVIVFALCLLFTGFGVIQLLQLAGKLTFSQASSWYLLLSYISKLTLGFLLFWGLFGASG